MDEFGGTNNACSAKRGSGVRLSFACWRFAEHPRSAFLWRSITTANRVSLQGTRLQRQCSIPGPGLPSRAHGATPTEGTVVRGLQSQGVESLVPLTDMLLHYCTHHHSIHSGNWMHGTHHRGRALASECPTGLAAGHVCGPRGEETGGAHGGEVWRWHRLFGCRIYNCTC